MALPEEDIETLAHDLERLAGGPLGLGYEYVAGALGMLTSTFMLRLNMETTGDLAKILGIMSRARARAKLVDERTTRGPAS